MSRAPVHPSRRRRPLRAAGVLALLVVPLLASIACTASPDDQTGGSAVSFQTELSEAEQMIAEATAIAGTDAPAEHTNSRGTNAAGAPDDSTRSRSIEVRWVSSDPPPFAAIRDRWTADHGFTVTSEDASSVFLTKGAMRASINQGTAGPDGARNVWFGVTTGTHPAAEVPEPR